MQITMYGIRSCHDCVDAENLLKEKRYPSRIWTLRRTPFG